MSLLAELAWPAERLGEGLALCARRAGLLGAEAEAREAGAGSAGPEEHALALGLELEAVDVPLGSCASFLRRGAPAVLAVRGADGEARWLLLARGGRAPRLLVPGGGVRRVSAERLAAELTAGLRAGALRHVDPLLARAGIAGRRAARARAALLDESLERLALGGSWLVRARPGASFLAAARRRRLAPRLALVVLAHAAAQAAWLLAWVAIGRGALEGRVQAGWLAAFALLVATAVPLRALERWLAGLVSIDLGALLKRRLLAGALALEPDEVRHLGAGQCLGRVLESDALEGLALGGGFLLVGAAVELPLAAWVLAQAPGGAACVLLLGLWLAVALAVSARAHAALAGFTRARVALTDDLVERMVGHRTRLAQEAPERWHDGEDERLERYLASARGVDRAAIALHGALPAAWLVLALVGLAPAFLAGAPAAGMAVGVAGALLAQGAGSKLVRGLFQLAGLRVAWRTVGPLFQAAARRAPPPVVAGVPAASEGAVDEPLLEARELSFRHAGRERPVLAGASFTLARGARVLVEGASGSGKSTLVALLTGLRRPQGGLLLLDGLDRAAQGEARWRRRVSAAPQLHENHVFAGTLAFNLLLARGWPAEERDLAEAEALCRELGLGPLLERMPAGLQQGVGEGGWQLSHGERSRVFLARALLAGGAVQVLDESVATLDPESLRQTMGCVLRRARTLVCVAHP